MKYAFPLLYFVLLTPAFSFGQPGCPDPQATNFNPSATANNGSCVYPVTNYVPVFKAFLPESMIEVSGHVKAGNNWYMHNDGSDGSRFYRFNPETGAITQEVQLKNASNKDWEDIGASATHVYLGDFGNNLNDRQDLGVYKVPLAKIGSGSSESVNENEWTFIPFTYADQTDFSTKPQDSTVFDCEAMLFFNNKIHLFTKNRRDYTTTHYIINQISGKAEKMETFDTDGMITGADVAPDGKLIVLLGYSLQGLPKVFAWLLWDWQAGSDLFFTGNKRRIELGSALVSGQAEGIGFAGNRTGYITNEETVANGITFVDQSVRWFDFGQWVPESTAANEPGGVAGFQVYPNPFSQTLQLRFPEDKKPDRLRVLNLAGQVVYVSNEVRETLDLAALPSGTYLIEALWGQKVVVSRGFKRGN